jgi:hypothetical protein
VVIIIPQGYGNVKMTMIDIRVIIRELIRGTPLYEMEKEFVSFITKLLFLKLIIFIFAVNIVCNLH